MLAEICHLEDMYLPQKRFKGICNIYQSYAKYKKKENEITYQSFDDDFHLALMEEYTYLIVENADIQKI